MFPNCPEISSLADSFVIHITEQTVNPHNDNAVFFLFKKKKILAPVDGLSQLPVQVMQFKIYIIALNNIILKKNVSTHAMMMIYNYNMGILFIHILSRQMMSVRSCGFGWVNRFQYIDRYISIWEPIPHAFSSRFSLRTWFLLFYLISFRIDCFRSS